MWKKNVHYFLTTSADNVEAYSFLWISVYHTCCHIWMEILYSVINAEPLFRGGSFNASTPSWSNWLVACSGFKYSTITLCYLVIQVVKGISVPYFSLYFLQVHKYTDDIQTQWNAGHSWLEELPLSFLSDGMKMLDEFWKIYE